AGCPAPDVTDSGGGSALLKDLPLLKECVGALAQSGKKTGVKIRLGWSKNEGVKIAKACESAGAQRIAVHGRTQKQGYSGKADWKAIAKVTAAVGIPVLGNGDVVSVADGIAKADAAGCNGFLVGRAALGWPGLFDGSGLEEKKSDFIRYAELQPDFTRLNAQAMMFSKGFPEARKVRRAVSTTANTAELVSLFERL
ncbi:MAG: tRNA-dihydrouridine synthase family protein, partial [Candidatus Micrarchaeota archaeon]